jgi:uncharacterized protein (TIGR02118 family)
MYGVNIMYPRKPGSDFDFDHYFNVHLPMGLGLFKRHLGILPKDVLVQKYTYGGDGKAESAGYHAICTLLFDTKAEADQFIGLFQVEEAASLLKADWPKYTEADPIVVLGEIVELNVQETAARGPAVIEEALAG